MTASQLSTFTTPITDASGKVVPGSIATMERVKLGGVDQGIVIRGNNATSPVLLFMNGGPGGTQLAWHREYMGALEENFVVVYWEQREVRITDTFGLWPHGTRAVYSRWS